MRKKVLITGKDSYIGDSVSRFCDGYDVDIVDTVSSDWKNTDFSVYDAVVHVAAIVHKQKRKFSDEEYYEVNCDLAYDIAKKAKEAKVKQFVFLSTMSVYGVLNGVITKDTKTKPFNIYGESKLKAENKISTLIDDDFTVTIVRPPIVYGKGCKGNYVELSRFASKFPFFPDYESKRSMIYIENLCAFIRKTIDERLGGVFCPQDKDYVSTKYMVSLIAKVNGKKIRLTKVFNPFINIALKMKISIVCKVFGSLTYEKDMCIDFEKVDLETAINRTENKA